MWKNDFVRLMFPASVADMDIVAAHELKWRHLPALYKYQPFGHSGSRLNAVRDSLFHATTPNHFNDPFDCMTMIDSGAFASLIRNEMISRTVAELPIEIKPTDAELAIIIASDDPGTAFTEISLGKSPQHANDPNLHRLAVAVSGAIEAQLHTLAETASLTVSSIVKRYLISSFTEKFDSILMWSHYAEQHTGFCVKYDFRALDRHTPPSRPLLPVIYGPTPFNATSHAARMSLYREDVGVHFGLLAAITKAKEWRYEREWRWVFPLGDPNRESVFVPSPPQTALYLGARVSAENLKLSLDVSEDLDIPLYKMEMSANSYRLTPHQIR